MLLSQRFRPFFLAAAVWAAFAIALWIAMLATGLRIPIRVDPITWHAHEMLFGFVMAAIAGYLLIMIPNWTRRLPVSGAPLAALAGLWLAGRIAYLLSSWLPPWLVVALDLSFPAALIAVVAREIVAGRSWRNLAVVGPVTILGIANLLMHLESLGIALPAGLGWRLAVAAVIVLISVVGGQIVPSFTRHWLAKRPGARLPDAPGWLDRAALVALPIGLLAWVVAPASEPVGWLLLLAAALHLWRLLRWRGSATVAQPLLLVLHIGYAWLVLGVGMLGLAVLHGAVPGSAAVHALTTGAIGTMILAVMMRTTRSHTGRPLTADHASGLIYGFVTLAAVTRIIAAFGADWTMPLLIASAGAWVLAFGLFIVSYGPMLLKRTAR